MQYDTTRPALRHTFSAEARDALVDLTYRFPVELAYMVDPAGDELVGLVPPGDGVHGLAIAYPVHGGFGAADECSVSLGVFESAEEVCVALAQHLRTLCAPRRLH